MPDVIYPLDPSGQLQSNRIIDEPHTLTEVNATTYRILIPKLAPFHTDNFKIIYVDLLGQETELVENVDYQLCLPYLGASRSIGKMIYGGASINREDLNGSLKVSYQTLGGEWIADSGAVLERIFEMAYNPRIVVWDVVTNKPNQFPPINHDQEFDYVFGHGDLIEKLDELKDAVLNGPNAANLMMRHIFFDSNPHNIDKNVVGLGNVQNIGVASDQEVLARELVDKHVTLRQIVQFLSSGMSGFSAMGASLMSAMDDGESLDLSSMSTGGEEALGQILIATLEEVLEKESIKKYVTLDTLVDAGFLFTIRDVLKSLDKNSVGLSQVDNIGMATDKEALDREPIDKYVTLRQLVTLGLLSPIPNPSVGSVQTPSILQPTQGSKTPRNLTVTASEFTSTYTNDTHVESEYRASKYPNMEDAIVISTTSGDLCKGVFSNLEAGVDIYLDVRYRSALGGWTDRSEVVKVHTSDSFNMLEQAKLIPNSYSFSTNFGNDVAISDDGNTAVICDDMDSEKGSRVGAAYVFTKVDGYWKYQTKLTPSDFTSQSLFGSSASISGDGNTIVIGARLSKSVYVFTRAGNGWVQTAKLKSDESTFDESFGTVVRISRDGSLIAVGAPKGQYSIYKTGLVYLFEKTGNNWYLSKKIYTYDSQENDFFGSAFSISDDNDHVLVGAYGHDLDGMTSTGAAYLFSKTDGEWDEGIKILPEELLAHDQFGKTVSISPDAQTIAVGSTGYKNTDGTSGIVYVFGKLNGVWTKVDELTTPEDNVESFGKAVQVSEDGSFIAVSADDTLYGSGVVYIYVMSEEGYVLHNTLRASDGYLGNKFGNSLSLTREGMDLVVGAPGADYSVNSFGSAYVYSAL